MNSSNKNVYFDSFDVAEQNGEIEQYHESGRINAACAKAVDKAITDSNYELYHYDLGTAARNVISEYGSERVNMILANTLQYKDYDGRFSRDNQDWAKNIPLPDTANDSRSSFAADTHPAILDGFINQVKNYERIIEVVSHIVREGTENTTSGNWIMGFDEIPQELMKPWQVKKNQDQIADMLSRRDEVADVTVNGGQLDVCYYLDYCPNYDPWEEELEAFSGNQAITHLSKEEKPSIIGRLQEAKKAAAQGNEQQKSAPKRNNDLEV